MISIFHKEATSVEFHSSSHKATSCFMVNIIITNRDFPEVFFKKKTVILDSQIKEDVSQGNYYRRTRLVTCSTSKTRLVTHSTHLITPSTRSTRLPTRSTRSTRLPTRSTRMTTGSTHNTCFSTRSTRLSTRSTRFSTRSTRLSIRLSIRSTRLSTRSTRLSTRSICLFTRSICLFSRSVRSAICRSFYNSCLRQFFKIIFFYFLKPFYGLKKQFTTSSIDLLLFFYLN